MTDSVLFWQGNLTKFDKQIKWYLAMIMKGEMQVKAGKIAGTVLAVLTAVFMSAGAINVQTVSADEPDYAAMAKKSTETKWKGYDTVQEAINALSGEPGAVQLMKNVTESIVIPEEAMFTLNLNGHNITNAEGKDTITNRSVSLTVLGSGTVDNVSHGKAAFVNEPGAVANLQGGTYTRSMENGSSAEESGGNSYYNIVNHGTMTIYDGVTVTQEGAFSSLLENGWYNGSQNTSGKESVLTIDGGTFSGGLNTIKNDDYGRLTINGGSFTNAAQAALLNWNKAEINGGTFEAGGNVILNGKLNDEMDQGELTIKGGEFISTPDKAVIAKMGGSSSIGEIVVADGIKIPGLYFAVTKDGKTLNYTTAVDAVDTVGDGESAVITLLDNYEGGGVKVDGTEKDITFDLAGYSWIIGTPLVGSTGTETNAFQLLKGNAVTFKNGAVTSEKAKILIQNYSDLTLDGVELTLTTPRPSDEAPYYVTSNNNGSTYIKGGTVINAGNGNYAMDAFTFGDYTGGNVFVEDAVINGNVELANGGDITLNGGTINGDVTVYNYLYQNNQELFNTSAVLTVNSGTINGDVTTSKVGKTVMQGGTVNGDVATSEKGETTIGGGEVTGQVTVNGADGAKTTVTGGVFGVIGSGVEVNAAEVATITDNGVAKTVVGLDNINQVLETVSENAVVTVQRASEGAALEAPAGVTVKNESGTVIKVNGEDLKSGSEVVVKAPESEKPQTDPDNKDKNNGKAEDAKAVQTGDSSNVILWVVLAVAAVAVAAGCVILYIRRRHKK